MDSMSSWRHETQRLFRFYLAVALIFAVWGLVGGCAVFLGGFDYNRVFIFVVAAGFLTALPVWSYLSQTSKAEARVFAFAGPTTTALVPAAAILLMTVALPNVQPVVA